MRKLIIVLLALLILFGLPGCGNEKAEAVTTVASTTVSTQEPTLEPTEVPIKEIKIGETITTSNYKVTLDDVAIGSDGYPGMLMNMRHDLGDYQGYKYDAFIVVTVKNLSKQGVKISASRKSCIKVEYDFNNGYIYNLESSSASVKDFGLHVLRDSGVWNSSSSGLDISPLGEGQAMWQIEIVEEAYKNRDVPSYIVITMDDGEQLRYRITENDYVN